MCSRREGEAPAEPQGGSAGASPSQTSIASLAAVEYHHTVAARWLAQFSSMTDNAHNRIAAVLPRFKQFEIDTGDPKWSSWLMDRMFEAVTSAPGGSISDIYRGLDGALETYSVPLTETES